MSARPAIVGSRVLFFFFGFSKARLHLSARPERYREKNSEVFSNSSGDPANHSWEHTKSNPARREGMRIAGRGLQHRMED